MTTESEDQFSDRDRWEKIKQDVMPSYGVLEVNEKSNVVHVKHTCLAEMIMTELGLHFHTVEDVYNGKQELFYYKDGFYHMGGENRVKELVDYFLDENTSIHRKNEIIDYIRNQNNSKRHEIEPALNLVNLKNGIFDINTNKLIPHSPDYYFIQKLPVVYKKGADCPKIKKFFKQVLYEKEIPLVQELFGFILYRDYFLHKAFLFVGGGSNGKGTTINLIERFLSPANYSNVQLQDFMSDRFATSYLYGKMANLGSEVACNRLTDTSTFKNLTGNEPIMGQGKFKNAFTFKNYAKLIFNANQVPRSTDHSFGFFRRWITISFPNTFDDSNPATDPNIIDRLSTPDEFSGLFNWAIEGLQRILKNYKFSQVYTDQEMVERYESMINPEFTFIEDFIGRMDGNTLPTEEVYLRYCKWSRQRNYQINPISTFTRNLKYWCNKRWNYPIVVKTIRKGGKVMRGYSDLCWKYKEDEHSQERLFDEDIEEA